MKKIKFTNNIYNDFESYKHKDIMKRVEMMQIGSTKYQEIKEGYKELYTVQVLYSEKEDPLYYSYTLKKDAISAMYFIKLLDEKLPGKILLYNLITEIYKDNEEIYYDVTDNYYYWESTEANRLKQELEEKEKELELYKDFLKKYNIDKEYIKEHIEEI